MRLDLRVALVMIVAAVSIPTPGAAAESNQLVLVAPCRAFDTRQSVAGRLAAGEIRPFIVRGDGNFAGQGGTTSGCGIPPLLQSGRLVRAVVINLVAVAADGPGHLKAWAPDAPPPITSVINFSSSGNIANEVTIPIRQDPDGAGDLVLQAAVSSVHAVGDIVGYLVPLVRTIVISPATGDPLASGKAFLSALESISNASSTEPWLLKLEPGTYDIGPRYLTMNPFVHIEGSGRHITTIQSDGTAGPLVKAGSAGGFLRSLTLRYQLRDGDSQRAIVVHTNGGRIELENVSLVSVGDNLSPTYGIVAERSSTIDLNNVEIEASAPESTTHPVIGIWSIESAILMRNVRVSTTGGWVATALLGHKAHVRAREVELISHISAAANVGVTLMGGSFEGLDVAIRVSVSPGSTGLQCGDYAGQLPQATLQNAIIDSTGSGTNRGIACGLGGDVEVRNSSVGGDDFSVAGPSSLKIANTRLEGPVQGTPTCAGVYDASYNFFPGSCP